MRPLEPRYFFLYTFFFVHNVFFSRYVYRPENYQSTANDNNGQYSRITKGSLDIDTSLKVLTPVSFIIISIYCTVTNV